MNILVISQYYYPEQFLINDIAPELVKRGHKVTVLTGLPNYPQGKILNEYKHGKKRDEMLNGVHVIRCTEIGRHNGKISLMLNYVSFPFFANRKVKKLKEKFDIVLSYQLSPVIMALPAVKYKEKFNVPVFLYCLDIWPESAQAHVKNDKGIIYKKIAELSKSIYKKCDMISVTSEPFISYLTEVNDIPQDRLCYIPQHADDKFLSEDLSNDNDGIVQFMFAGNLGAGQTLEVIIEAAALLKDRHDFKVHLVGDGSRTQALKQLAKDKGVDDKIIFDGRHTYDEMKDYYKSADALLITLRGNNFVGNTMPGKLQIYMTTGKPIFGAINGAAQQVIKQSGCGECVDSGDSEGLSRLMLDFIEHPDKYKNCGENAARFFKKNFTKSVFIEKLEKQLNKTIQSYKGT